VKNLILTGAHPKTTHPLGCVVLFMFYSLLYSLLLVVFEL